MALSATGQAQLNTPAPTSFSAGTSTGVRQALALVGGAVETSHTIRREARFIERREPKPFSTTDQVEIRTPPSAEDKPPAPEPKSEPAELRKLSLTGQPVAERELRRGELLDIEA